MNRINPIIGWIGTGVMGFNMCKHLINANHEVLLYNRTASKAQKLIELGGKWLKPIQIAQQADIMFLMLGYPKDLQEMCLGQNGIIRHMKKGSILVDHTTSKPQLAETLYHQCKKYDIGSIDAPVSGGDIGARDAKLVAMCGGDEDIFERVKPFLSRYSRRVQRCGDAGKGQHTKVANQIVFAENMASACQGILYASKMGLDLNKTLDIITLGSANSYALEILGRRAINNDMNPGYYVEHFLKDLQICVQQSTKMGLCLPVLSIIKNFVLSLKANGGDRLGAQSLIKVLQQLNNHKINK